MSQEFLDKLFIKARSHNNWKNKDIDEKILKDLYDLVKNCPTSANSEPMRIIFLKSKECTSSYQYQRCLFSSCEETDHLSPSVILTVMP